MRIFFMVIFHYCYMYEEINPNDYLSTLLRSIRVVLEDSIQRFLRSSGASAPPYNVLQITASELRRIMLSIRARVCLCACVSLYYVYNVCRICYCDDFNLCFAPI